MNKIVELFGHSVQSTREADWRNILEEQNCIYTGTRCFKVRKSDPEVSIGTCTVSHGKKRRDIIVCPNRLLHKRQVFTDCAHLLTRHDPGNEFHVISEISIPGGSVDYFLASVKNNKVKDFVGIEFQTLDTTGTVYPERQRLLEELGFEVADKEVSMEKPFGINWKMTAKTALVQLHHKIETFEHIGRHLVLIVQDCLLDYMYKEFNFAHLSEPGKAGDSMHLHAYSLESEGRQFKLALTRRLSTDAEGVSTSLGLRAEAKVEFAEIAGNIEARISDATLLHLA